MPVSFCYRAPSRSKRGEGQGWFHEERRRAGEEKTRRDRGNDSGPTAAEVIHAICDALGFFWSAEGDDCANECLLILAFCWCLLCVCLSLFVDVFGVFMCVLCVYAKRQQATDS